MTCVDAGIFYGIKLRKLKKGESFLNKVFIILYKQLNDIKLTKEEKQIAENLKPSDDEEPSTIEHDDEDDDEEEEEVKAPAKSKSKAKAKSSSSASSSVKKRRHVEDDDEDDEDDEGEEDFQEYNQDFYKLLTKAHEFLGFTVSTSKGNTWNGNGFKCLVLFEPVNSSNCSSFNPQDLIDMEKNVSDEKRNHVAMYLKMIGHAPAKLSWYLYPSAG